ncbi:replication protein [Escherichia coli]|nr:replication protein [Escherichia coli]
MGVVKLADYRHNPVQHQEASSMGMSLYTASLWTAGSIRTLRQYIFGFT